MRGYPTVSLLLLAISISAFAQVKNGFDLSNSQIPAANIHQGGPPKDGIPSIDQPKFVAASQAGFLKPNDKVIGIVYAGEQRAYPIKILNWHEIVNDKIGGQGVAVTFCPLCGTGMVFQSHNLNGKGRAYHFGVSGLLYNSDVLLYDRETQTLWSQILSRAVSGALKGKQLRSIPSAHIRWQDWKKQHPKTKVLSTDTSFSRDYNRSPYGSYNTNRSIYFPLTANSNKYHPKERVLGLCVKQRCKAYPFAELTKTGKRVIQDNFAGQSFKVSFDPNNRDGQIVDSKGRVQASVNSFWFAWYAFHPKTEVYSR